MSFYQRLGAVCVTILLVINAVFIPQIGFKRCALTFVVEVVVCGLLWMATAWIMKGKR